MLKLIFTDYQIIVTFFLILAAWKWGDWKHWKLYYPTMLFFATGSLATDLVLMNYPLWSFESPLLGMTFSNLLITLVFFPATILIFIPHFPKKRNLQIAYIIVWALIYTLIEFLSDSLGFFSHYHGWSIWWTLLFNLLMFPIFIIHHKRPLLAISISFILAIIMLTYFKVPISSIK